MFSIWSNMKFNQINVLVEGHCRFAFASYSTSDCISWYRLMAYYSFAGLKGVKWVKVYKPINTSVFVRLLFCISRAREVSTSDSCHERSLSQAVCFPCTQQICKKCLLKGAYLFETTVEAKNSWIVILLLPPSYYTIHIILTINQFPNKKPLIFRWILFLYYFVLLLQNTSSSF